MSRNLIKGNWTYTQEKDTFVVDNNEQVAKRIELLKSILQTDFQSLDENDMIEGIDAEQVSALLADDGSEGSSNVIKGDNHPQVLKLKEQMEQERAELLDNAAKEAEEIIQNAKAEALQIKDEAHRNAKEEGYRAGYEEGLAKAKALEEEGERKLKQLAVKEKELLEEYDRMLHEAEPKLVDAIVGVYEHLFKVDISKNKEIALHLIENTIRGADSNRDFIVRVSKEDHPAVSAQKERLTACLVSPNATLEIIADMTLKENECLIETEGGIFDCGLGTQLEELNRELRMLSYDKD